MNKKTIAKMAAILCGVLMIFALAACKADTAAPGKTDPAPVTTEAQEKSTIVGSWQFVAGDFTYTFNEDGTGTYDAAGTLTKFNYEATDTHISVVYEDDVSMEVDYSISGNVLKLTDTFGNDTLYNRK